MIDVRTVYLYEAWRYTEHHDPESPDVTDVELVGKFDTKAEAEKALEERLEEIGLDYGSWIKLYPYERPRSSLLL